MTVDSTADFLDRPVLRQIAGGVFAVFVLLIVIPATRPLVDWPPVTICAGFVAAGAVLLMQLNRRPATARDILGVVRDRRSWWLLAVVVPLLALTWGFVMLTKLGLSGMRSVSIGPASLVTERFVVTAPVGWSIVAITFVLIAPVIEEVVFRGIVYRRLIRRSGPVRGAAVTSLLFAILHGEWIGHFLFGLVMIVLLLRSGSLWLPIVGHGLYNLLSAASTLRRGAEPSYNDFMLGTTAGASPRSAGIAIALGAAGLVAWWYYGLEARRPRELLVLPLPGAGRASTGGQPPNAAQVIDAR